LSALIWRQKSGSGYFPGQLIFWWIPDKETGRWAKTQQLLSVNMRLRRMDELQHLTESCNGSPESMASLPLRSLDAAL